MARQNSKNRKTSNSKNWALLAATVIPVWAVVLFVGWFVISNLVPMLEKDEANQVATEIPENAILDFSTASGKDDTLSSK